MEVLGANRHTLMFFNHWLSSTYEQLISGLNFLKVNQNEKLFQRSIPKLNINTTRYVFLRPRKI